MTETKLQNGEPFISKTAASSTGDERARRARGGASRQRPDGRRMTSATRKKRTVLLFVEKICRSPRRAPRCRRSWAGIPKRGSVISSMSRKMGALRSASRRRTRSDYQRSGSKSCRRPHRPPPTRRSPTSTATTGAQPRAHRYRGLTRRSDPPTPRRPCLGRLRCRAADTTTARAGADDILRSTRTCRESSHPPA